MTIAKCGTCNVCKIGALSGEGELWKPFTGWLAGWMERVGRIDWGEQKTSTKCTNPIFL